MGPFRNALFFGVLGALLVSGAMILRARARAAPIHLTPRYFSGESLRYDFELRSNTTGRTKSPIEDPEGATQLKQSASVLLRLDVLGVGKADGGAMSAVRFRATYEKSAANTESNSFDPQAQAIVKQYRKLQGRSIEFTLEPGGKITSLEGIKDILPDASMAAAMRQWLVGLSLASTLPRKGISIGEKWSAAQPLAGAPLAGLEWKTESSYLRNELCSAGSSVAFSASPPGPHKDNIPETCAIILTRYRMARPHGRGDATPEEYRRNGLRTSGDWEGQGESLTAISIANGLVVSLTQSGTQRINLTIMAAAGRSQMHYTGQVQTASEITLLSASPPAR